MADFHYLGLRNTTIEGRPYEFYTIARGRTAAWMPATEQQHVNPVYRGEDPFNTVDVKDVNMDDVARIIQQIILFQTRRTVPLKTILSDIKYEPLRKEVSRDYVEFGLLGEK